MHMLAYSDGQTTSAISTLSHNQHNHFNIFYVVWDVPANRENLLRPDGPKRQNNAYNVSMYISSRTNRPDRF